MRLSTLGVLCLASLSACSWSPWGARPPQDEASSAPRGATPADERSAAPAHASGAGSRLLGVAVPDYPRVVDLPSWVQSGDDFIEGTVVSATLSWSPLRMWRLGEGFFGEVSDCSGASPVMDVVLTDVISLVGGTSPATLTVRMGSGSWDLEGLEMITEGSVLPPGDPGPPTWWEDGVDPLAPGTRIGGPIYEHPSHHTPVFGTGIGQPMYRVVHGAATLTRPGEGSYSRTTPDLDRLEGMSPSALAAEIGAANEAEAPLVEAYRGVFRLDDPEYTHLYAAGCRTLAPRFLPQDPDTGDPG